jgi:hypothetical protein
MSVASCICIASSPPCTCRLARSHCSHRHSQARQAGRQACVSPAAPTFSLAEQSHGSHGAYLHLLRQQAEVQAPQLVGGAAPPRAGSRQQAAGSREQGAGSREQGGQRSRTQGWCSKALCLVVHSAQSWHSCASDCDSAQPGGAGRGKALPLTEVRTHLRRLPSSSGLCSFRASMSSPLSSAALTAGSSVHEEQEAGGAGGGC